MGQGFGQYNYSNPITQAGPYGYGAQVTPSPQQQPQPAASIGVGNPPPGISPSFWQELLQKTPKRREYLESGRSGSFGPYKDKAEFLRALEQEAKATWDQKRDDEKNKYTAADAAGLGSPNTTQGMTAQQLAEAQSQYGTAMGGHTQDVAEQRQNLYKLKQQSDPRITAEEKLMMEMTRREADADYKGKVGATMNEMQARGMGGSGAEFTRNLAGASDSANRHAIEALGAQANAQKRAMDSLGKATDLSTTMATQSGADVTNAGNKIDKLKQDQWDARNAIDEGRAVT